MNIQTQKCVILIDKTLTTGTIANVAAVLSLSLGRILGEIVGPDIIDKSGERHHGLTQLPIPVLGALSHELREVRKNILSTSMMDVILVDFNNYAQRARSYDEYVAGLQSASPEDITYSGIALCGNKKIINQVTKGLKLLGN